MIRIIRNEDEPKPKLIKRFKLTEIQAEAILETKLRHLAKLEEMKIRGEQDELAARARCIWKRRSSPTRLLKQLVRDEIIEDAEEFGDARRSPLVEREAAQQIDQTALLPTEPITVVLSEKGWVRAAKGHEMDPETLDYKAGDNFHQARARQEQPAGGVPRFHRPHLFAAGAQAALGARPRRAACPAASIRPPARPGPA